MNLPHHFGTKPAGLSASWLDDNFEALVKRCQELEDRLNSQGQFVAEQNSVILQLNAAIQALGNTETIRDRVLAKLAEKPAPKKKGRK